MCDKCDRPFYILADRPSDMGIMCQCEPETVRYGWHCKACGELWYSYDAKCDCGAPKPDAPQVVYFRDDKVESTRGFLRNLWISLFG